MCRKIGFSFERETVRDTDGGKSGRKIKMETFFIRFLEREVIIGSHTPHVR